MPKPLKRAKALEEVSRDHHHGLLLSWKIRKGLKNNIAPERMKRYTDWFWRVYLKAHFEIEEKHIFPVLDADNKLIKRATREHRRLTKLFTSTENLDQNLSLIEEELVAHIRFEERVLFQEIQSVATPAQLRIIEESHTDKKFEEWEDAFWLEQNEA